MRILYLRLTYSDWMILIGQKGTQIKVKLSKHKVKLNKIKIHLLQCQK